jgi:transcriptional regulator with XRE-family HTH domain
MGGQSSFGGMRRELRQSARFTQKELAAHSGLCVRSISDLGCDGSGRPFLRSVKLLVDRLQVSEQDRTALHEAARARHGGEEPGGPEGGVEPGEQPARPGWLGNQFSPVVADFTGREDECAHVRTMSVRQIR